MLLQKKQRAAPARQLFEQGATQATDHLCQKYWFQHSLLTTTE